MFARDGRLCVPANNRALDMRSDDSRIAAISVGGTMDTGLRQCAIVSPPSLCRENTTAPASAASLTRTSTRTASELIDRDEEIAPAVTGLSAVSATVPSGAIFTADGSPAIFQAIGAAAMNTTTSNVIAATNANEFFLIIIQEQWNPGSSCAPTGTHRDGAGEAEAE